MSHRINKAAQVFVAVMLATIASAQALASNLVDIKFSAMPGDVTQMELIFDGQPPVPGGYTIEKPARISLDLPGVNSKLASKYHKIGFGNARTATVVSANERARVIVSLAQLVPYTVQTRDDRLVVLMGKTVDTNAQDVQPNQALANVDNRSSNAISASASATSSVMNVDFRRGDQNDGQVQILLSNPKAGVNVQQQGKKIIVTLENTVLPENMRRRLDVVDFATPVKFIDANMEGTNTVIYIEPEGQYDYLAYQADGVLAINVKPITKAEKEKLAQSEFPYSGEKLSLNFQNIEVRAVLQLIADFTGQNLVASDTVDGGITLRLQNVPWDQALDLVLKTKGLAKRQMGNVLLVAPAEEIAAREKIELEAVKQVEDLAPLLSEYVQLRYAKATDIASLLTSESGLMSLRGTAVVDERTNTLLMRDTGGNLDKIREAIALLDIPVRQVLIEARIVIANTSVGEKLGIRWGGGGMNATDDSFVKFGASQTTLSEANQILIDRANGDDPGSITFPDAYVVDLGVSDVGASSLAVGISTFDYLLDLELSAVETDGNAEIVSQPRVITADGQTASIQSGTEIPYQEASSSGATSISFKSAVLRLEVTPQITPDDRIIMDLKINQDSIGEVTAAGPTIDTNALETQVLVENGETIVLGGIFRSEETYATTKTPFFGDIPLLGVLFRRTEHSESKAELLIFITPRLVKDTLSTR
ncbi:Type 4 pilus biogenesis protein [Oleispira antarctica RB-8]|uniref:Type 4 pilus biogenesis protein n=1 Tax=Oleispira antarctica RB-8 TaxID=698738 RepID=R4YRT8_OLEAN|nr:Type 4 pilus biogenesis protein [Oleispira antarctica RB-8]